MPTHLDLLIESIGETALEYINGHRKGRKQDEISPLSIKNPDEVQLREHLTRLIEDVSDEGKKKAYPDATGRRRFLEFIADTYIHCYCKINSDKHLAEEDWTEINKQLTEFLSVCYHLRTSDFTHEVGETRYELTSFRYQETAVYLISKLNVGSEHIGNMGSLVNTKIFKQLTQRPDERTYGLQILDMITNHRNRLLENLNIRVLEKLESLSVKDQQISQLTEIVAEQKQSLRSIQERQSAMQHFGFYTKPQTPSPRTVAEKHELKQPEINLSQNTQDEPKSVI